VNNSVLTFSPIVANEEFWALPVSAQVNATGYVARSESLGLFVMQWAQYTLISANGKSWSVTNSATGSVPGTIPTPTSLNWFEDLGLFYLTFYAGSTGSFTSWSATSPDGVTWTRTSTPTLPIGVRQVIKSTSTWVAIASTELLHSTDGVVWTSVTLPPDGIMPAIYPQNGVWAADKGIFVIGLSGVTLGVGQPAQLWFATSTDGVTWGFTLPPYIPGPWPVIAYSPELGIFSLVGSGGNGTYTSTNGIDWTPRNNLTSYSSINPWSISWVSKLHAFLVTGDTGAPQGNDVAWLSRDGMNWSPFLYSGLDNTGCIAYTGALYNAAWSDTLNLAVIARGQGCAAITWSVTSGFVGVTTNVSLTASSSSQMSFWMGKVVPATLHSIDASNFIPSTYKLSAYGQPKISIKSTNRLPVRFGQAFNEGGQPLPLHYLNNGYPSTPHNVDSPYSNAQTFFTVPPADQKLRIYDFYGLNLNDPQRGPYFSDQNVTISQIDHVTLEVRKDHLGNLIYASTLNDEFGNQVIRGSSSLALKIKKQLLPLELDSFNRPIKEPTNDV